MKRKKIIIKNMFYRTNLCHDFLFVMKFVCHETNFVMNCFLSFQKIVFKLICHAKKNPKKNVVLKKKTIHRKSIKLILSQIRKIMTKK